jgi:ribose-phosphate pyrophosphokinase
VHKEFHVAQLMLFSGNATPNLSRRVSDYLAVPLGNASVGRFSDGEIAVEIVENVRGEDVFVTVHLCTHQRQLNGTCGRL